MRTSRSIPFNPFIVLCDVTISTLVLLACLLMIFGPGLIYRTTLDKRKQQQALEIAGRQEVLLAKAKKEWPKDLILLNARGLQSYLFRFADPRLFDKKHPHQLSPLGQRTIRTWGKRWARELRELQEKQIGALVEVQVRGHCSPRFPKGQPGADVSDLYQERDPWTLSIRRAMIAARELQKIKDFPSHLLSVSGYAWHRRAFLSSREARRKGLEQKPALLDRIDILLVFSGDQYDNNFITPWDGRRTYGPINDVSCATLTDWEERQ